MSELYTQRIKAIAGNATTQVRILPTASKRVHRLQLQMTFPAGVAYDTLAEVIAVLTEIRVLVGTVVKWRLSGVKLRDFVMLRGSTYDFDHDTTNNILQLTIPLAPEWYFDVVADQLAFNPVLAGAPLSVEVDSSAAITVVADEVVSDDLDAPSAGFMSMEVIKVTAGGTEFTVQQPEIKLSGRLISAHIYPDSTNSREITPVSLQLGENNRFAFENRTSAQNDEALARYGLTPALAGRTANIFDLVAVKSDALSQAWDLAAWGKAVLTIGAAAAMGGTCDILLCRLENWWRK